MKVFSVVLFIVFSGLSYGQESLTVEGRVIDLDGNAVDLALVVLVNQTDTTQMRIEYSDEDGSFLFTGIEADDYILKISMLGFNDYQDYISITSSRTIDQVQLLTDVNLIQQVTISSTVPFVERKIDRLVVTPSAMIGNAGSNALEVIEKAPGLTVDSEGGISLKGRSGVVVFINDKPSYLSGSELENYLRSLPAGSIKQIEIMENPPAKYEAAGNAGVINIIIKRSTLKGFFGNASLAYKRSRYNNSNNSLNLNYNKDKISLYTNLSGGLYKNFQDLNINRYFKGQSNETLSSFAQNSFNNRKGEYFNVKIGLDYYINETTTIGIASKGSKHPSQKKVDNTSVITDSNDRKQHEVVADNVDDRSFNNRLYNVYVSKKLDTLGTTLSLDADHVVYSSLNTQVFKNFVNDSIGSLVYEDQIDGRLPSDIKIYAIKSDFTKPFKSGSRLEAGVKMAFTSTDNEADYSNTIAGVTSPDYDLSNRFLYDEWINAAYVNHNRTLSGVDFQLGLRAESTNLTGEQLGNVEKIDSSFTRSYTSMFPTFYAATKLDSSGFHQVNFSYGRRINRPYFQDLNPFISPLNQFTFYGGNPDLLPTYSHNFSINHSFKNILNTSLSYSKTLDGIYETLEIREGIYYSRPGNIATDQSITLSLNASLPVKEWYALNAYFEVGHLMYDSPLYTEQLNSSGTYYYFFANNSFQLGNGWKAELSGRYVTDVVVAQLKIENYGLLNCGVKKSLWDGKASIQLSANDILYTRRGSGIINNLSNTDADWNSKYDSRSVVCTFSTRFGKASNKQKHSSSGSESEQQRVKS